MCVLDENILASCSWDGSVRIWNWYGGGKNIKTLVKQNRFPVLCVCFIKNF